MRLREVQQWPVESGAAEHGTCLGSWDIPGGHLLGGWVHACFRKALPDCPGPLTHKGHKAGLVHEYPDTKAENQAA